MSTQEPIFCCAGATPMNAINNTKLHKDPNRQVHEAIFTSFMNFAHRRQTVATLMALIQTSGSGGSRPPTSVPSSYCTSSAPQQISTSFSTLEELRDNPITLITPYVMHLTSRLDFGPVLSHRYFVCPSDLKLDWVETSLGQWFAAGEPFKLKAEKWNVKCLGHSKFHSLTLRPNLTMRFHPGEQAIGSFQGAER